MGTLLTIIGKACAYGVVVFLVWAVWVMFQSRDKGKEDE